MFCPHCGASNAETNTFCQSCGAPLRADAGPGAPRPPAGPDPRGLESSEKALLYFGNLCISPILGLVLYFVWKDGKPRKSREVCTVTLWAMGTWAILFFLFLLLGVLGSLAGA